ncbi:uncharacterized protein [Clytia hemisphaerica]|uniref:uncharacterized protein n=1 Tax=Clytia hemisphaerica TaxID=252671 RepID=UPI0034D589A2
MDGTSREIKIYCLLWNQIATRESLVLTNQIMGLVNDTIPNFAQWNYRIMCHPLKRHLPTKRLRVIEDLSARMRNNKDILRHALSRSARYQLNTQDQDTFRERPESWKTLLDELMEEIPGKDNYQVDLEDEGLDGKAMQLDGSKLNAGYYHRWFTIGADAMGSVKQHRGYNDDYMFAALNTQEKIAGVEFNKCVKNKGNKGKKECQMFRQKWSYAIPLEIIYMTPLYKWNPYKLKHHGDQTTANLKIINGNGKRNGNCAAGAAKAYTGINSRNFYMTPAAFYSGASVESSAADTARGVTCVLDQDGVERQVRAAGTHIFLPQIKDVGVLRTRYPIFPVHGEGSSVWKELNAVREVTMNEEKWQKMYWKNADLDSGNEDTTLLMGESTCACAPRHTHEIKLDAAEVQMLKGGHTLTKESTTTNAHFHSVQIRYEPDKKFFYFTTCDAKYQCWDKHVKQFVISDS